MPTAGNSNGGIPLLNGWTQTAAVILSVVVAIVGAVWILDNTITAQSATLLAAVTAEHDRASRAENDNAVRIGKLEIQLTDRIAQSDDRYTQTRADIENKYTELRSQIVDQRNDAAQKILSLATKIDTLADIANKQNTTMQSFSDGLETLKQLLPKVK